VSLAEASILASKDSSLHPLEKSEIQAIFEHIQNQLSCLSNQERKDMTVDNFIFNNHFSDSSSYNDYSSQLLKKKIESVIGDSSRPDFQNDIVDWELGETRTNPSDHKALEEKDINSYLKTTAKGDKSAFRILNDELTSVESSG
jgi:hypothetical protein